MTASFKAVKDINTTKCKFYYLITGFRTQMKTCFLSWSTTWIRPASVGVATTASSAACATLPASTCAACPPPSRPGTASAPSPFPWRRSCVLRTVYTNSKTTRLRTGGSRLHEFTVVTNFIQSNICKNPLVQVTVGMISEYHCCVVHQKGTVMSNSCIKIL